jgi:hypothetical protein
LLEATATGRNAPYLPLAIYTSLLPAAVSGEILGDFSKSMSAEASASKKDALQNEPAFPG